MQGYDPRCPNCHRCSKCQGDGTIKERRWVNDKMYEERKTCPSCRGVGGRVGVGNHNHN
jgi:DnaJ-class molecular chaperone